MTMIMARCHTRSMGLLLVISCCCISAIFRSNDSSVHAFSEPSRLRLHFRRQKQHPISSLLQRRQTRAHIISKTTTYWQLFSQSDNQNDENNNNNKNPSPDDNRANDRRAETTNDDATTSANLIAVDVQPRVYPQRWIQLACLSALALMSDWICFSVAAAPETYETVYQHSSASLIDLFLFTNVASCFLVTDVVAKIGLERAVKNSAVLMTLGCWLRSGIAFWNPAVVAASTSSSSLLVSYPWVVVGTIFVGAAQPFFQCTPPVLSALWFADTERATSTAVALNFNQVGIATAFLVGGAMATDVPGLAHYFGLISIACTMITIATLWQFQSEPPIPPSASELEKKLSGKKEPPFLESVQKFFQTRGFSKALAAFICSISITNIVGAFIAEIMERGGITDRLQIDLSGAAFEFAIVLGGILIGGYVDRTKQYKLVTLACLAATLFTIIPLGLTEHRIGQEPFLLLMSLIGLGMAAGPIQPINAELSCDITYPGDETAVESVQQIGGNMISALLVPVAEFASRRDYLLLPNNPLLESDIRGDCLLLLTVAALTMAYFSTFDAPLARTMADRRSESDPSTSLDVSDAPLSSKV